MGVIPFAVTDLEGLRLRVGAWSRRNFGSTLPKERPMEHGMLRCVAGMAEELAELIESGWGLTPSPANVDEYLDAIADICIYALDFCYQAEMPMAKVLTCDVQMNRWEKHFDELVANGQPANHVLHEGLTVLIGKLCHGSLKICQGIRRTEDHMGSILLNMCHVWRLCYELSAWQGRDLSLLVLEIGEKVTKRDWVGSPDTAHQE